MKTKLWVGLPLLAGMVGWLALGARAAESGGSVFDQARLEGRALANSIVSQKPTEGNTLIGKLTILPAGTSKRTEIPIKFQTLVSATNWQNLYLMHDLARNRAALLTVIHAPPKPNVFVLATVAGTGGSEEVTQLTGNQAMMPFAGSDFWVIDLGLEFFHWPVQRVTSKEFLKGMACRVLESVNPNPAPGAYRRVVSWVDIETLGIVKAEAYDANDRLFKTFTPKKFKKLAGRWQLKEMEIRNVRADSKTTISFDLPDD